MATKPTTKPKLTSEEANRSNDEQPRGVTVLVKHLVDLLPANRSYYDDQQIPTGSMSELQQKINKLDDQIEDFENKNETLLGMKRQKRDLELEFNKMRKDYSNKIHKLIGRLQTKGATPTIRQEVLEFIESM